MTTISSVYEREKCPYCKHTQAVNDNGCYRKHRNGSGNYDATETCRGSGAFAHAHPRQTEGKTT